jgi:hypothetical protein
MRNKAALSALLGVVAAQQGRQCANNRWGVQQKNTDCWLKWSGWSECAGHCGQSTQTATRKCRGNIPGMGGCQGSELRRQRCRDNQVVQGKSSYCPYWSFWSEWGGCQVQPSTDPCVINVHGMQRRTRTCHDPFASERGEVPQCQGDELETRACTNNYQGYTPQLPANEYIEGAWSQCSAQCGDGVEKCMQTHICANVVGTWVDESKWYRHVERACQRSCCQPEGQRETEEVNDPCNGGYRREWQFFIDYYGGCAQLAKTNTNMRQISYRSNQWVDEIRVEIPVAYPPQSAIQYCQDAKWGFCTPQDFTTELSFFQTSNAQELQAWIAQGLIASEQSLGVQKFVQLTTAGGNGRQFGQQAHCCAESCQSHSCPTWQSPPYSMQYERACGEPAVLQFKCDESFDRCNPKCFVQFVEAGSGNVLQVNEVACGVNPGCGGQRTATPPFPICTCDVEQVTRQGECQPVEVKQCPPHQITEQMGAWQEASQLIEFRNRGQCVCQAWEQFRDQRWNTITEVALENPSQICRQSQVDAGTQINAYATATCWGPERCEMNTCDDTVCGATYNCYQTDECTGMPRVVRTEKCPLNPAKPNPCCTITPWKQVSECSNAFICPRDSMNTQSEFVRYMVNSQTGQSDEQCKFANGDNAEYKAEACPRIPCPGFGEWTAWSQCSNIINACHCGGNRQRSRQHPCGVEGQDNQGCPAANEPFSEYDSWTPQHHSQYCHSLMNDNLSSDSCISVAVGEWTRDTCIGQNQYQMVRKTVKTHTCPGIPEEVIVDKQVVDIPCIETPVLDQPLPECDSTNNDQACCKYDATRCSAVVQRFCVSQDKTCQPYNNLIDSQPATAIQCPIDNPVVSQLEGECLVKDTYSLERALMSADVCVGVCEVTNVHKCGQRGAVSQVDCDLNTRNPMLAMNTFQCSAWTDFLPVTPFVDPSKTVEVVTTSQSGSAAITVTCDPCGGKLMSSRKCPCKVYDNVFKVQDEGREIVCPAPQYTWTAWSDCPVCINNKADRNAMRTRQTVTDPAAMHCSAPRVESEPCMTTQLCMKPCPSVEKVCMHPLDPQANCGKGRLHSITTTYQCDYTGQRLENSGIVSAPVDLMEECNLPFQRVMVPTNDFGCQTLQEQCEGGQILQNQVMRCIEPEARNPRTGYVEDIQTVQVGTCPPKPIIQVIPEPGMCAQCQDTTVDTRRCVGGTFQDNCQCQSFGRECCQRDPTYTLSADGTTESKVVQCPPQYIPPTWVNITSPPNCDCDCTEKTCPQDFCTGQIDYNQCKIVKQGYTGGHYHQIEVMPLTECKWTDSSDPMHTCNTMGWQEQQCIHHCLNNTRLNPPHVQWHKINMTSFTSYNGYEYTITNSQFYAQLKTCKFEKQRTQKMGECDYTDPCNPVARVDEIESCQGAEQIVATNYVPCGEVLPPTWTPFTECSVECGQGVKTRKFIQQCSNTILDVEEVPCGCPISRWSDWSDWVGVCQECGPEVQTRTQSRTCVEPQANIDTAAGAYVTYMSNGLYRSRVSSVVDSTCSDKCMMCTPDADGATTIRTQQFSRDAECPTPTQTIRDSCPMDRSVCTQSFFERTLHCGKQVGDALRISCPTPRVDTKVAGPCLDSNGIEITTCGTGFRTITIQDDLCSPPRTVQEACVGPYGQIVQKTIDLPCSATCGGGQKVYRQESVCEQLINGKPYVIDSLTRTTTETCNNIPCAYWLGWSSWTQCSSTCGAGQRQRTRKCSGGAPGDGGCLPHHEFYKPVNSPVEVRFDPVGNGAVHTEACDEGDCCTMEWSGWSNCCIHSDQTKKRVKYEVNKCTGQRKLDLEECNDVQTANDNLKLQTCDALYNIRKYGGATTISTGTTISQWDVSYGRRIDNGLYRIAYQDYRLVNNGEEQVWYLIQADGSEVVVEVENYSYSACAQCQTTYYYRFGNNWYKWSNNQFNVQITSPPSYSYTSTPQNVVISTTTTEEIIKPVTTYYSSYGTRPISGYWNVDSNTQQLYKAPMVAEASSVVGSISQPMVQPAATSQAYSTSYSGYSQASASASSSSSSASASSNSSFKDEADMKSASSLFSGGNF